MYQYKATLDRVIDGDTVIVNIDLGFSLNINVIIRLSRVNTYEIYDKDLDKRRIAQEEKKLAYNLLSDSPFTVKTTKTGKYGRWIGEIILIDGRNFNDLMYNFHKGIVKK